MATRPPDREPELFAISPGRGDRAELQRVLPQLAAGGLRRFLLREKQLDGAARAKLAGTLAPLCRSLGLELWIAEDFELAQAVGAAGVQLSERSPPPSEVAKATGGSLRLGVSLHADLSRPGEELVHCEHAFLAPVFSPQKEPGRRPLGADGFACLAAGLPLPVFALGGIGLDHLPLLAARGVSRVAAIRLCFGGGDPRAAVERARALLAPRAREA
jgi:thiamine-phosphate diphosphorylase